MKRIGGLSSLIGAILAVAALAGCTKSDPPSFHLNVLDLEQQEVAPEQQKVIATVLEAMYGTPNTPFVLSETKLDLTKIERAAGPVWSDEHGRREGLYRRHCGHCHGTTGDGMGPTASILNPYPRDYRQGKFKFKSTERAAKPTDADLKHILYQGIPGTAMPSFALLPDDELDALVEYVKYLSMRGETERALVAAVVDLGEGEKLSLERSTLVDEILQPIAESWATAGEAVIAIPARPETKLADSINQGRELFYGNRAACVKCHGPSALGDGQTNDYDDWDKPLAELARSLETADASPEGERSVDVRLRDARIASLLDMVLPPRPIHPRNLRAGVYRGGGRPIDLYRRIHAGINGVPMPAVGPSAPGGQATLKSEEIWHLVDYVRSLPYEPISRARHVPSVVGQRPL